MKKLEDIAKRIATRSSVAMSVVLRNVVNHNWGWFSREDQRMHLQTVDAKFRDGSEKIKFWLESKGKRIFELANGKINSLDFKRMQKEVSVNRKNVEAQWVHFMIQNKWLQAHLKNNIVTLIAYPGSHNKFSRKINLEEIFPGMFPYWIENPPIVDFDEGLGLLRIGLQENKDNRSHLDVSDFLFLD